MQPGLPAAAAACRSARRRAISASTAVAAALPPSARVACASSAPGAAAAAAARASAAPPCTRAAMRAADDAIAPASVAAGAPSTAGAPPAASFAADGGSRRGERAVGSIAAGAPSSKPKMPTFFCAWSRAELMPRFRTSMPSASLGAIAKRPRSAPSRASARSRVLQSSRDWTRQLMGHATRAAQAWRRISTSASTISPEMRQPSTA